MKPLKPTMREKKRYLLVVGNGNLKENIFNSLKDFFGTQGMAKTALNFIHSEKGEAIISINREMLNQVRAAICIFPEKMEIKKVSGTLNGLKK